MTRRPAARAAPRRKSVQGSAAPQLIPAFLTPARKREIAGATLLAVGVLTLVSFVSNRGQVTGAWVAFLGRLLGDGRWLLPFLLGGIGAWLLVDSMDDQVDLRLQRPLGALACFVGLLGLWQLMTQGLTAPDGAAPAAGTDLRGGFLGYHLARVLAGALGPVPAAVVFILAAGDVARLALQLAKVRDRLRLRSRVLQFPDLEDWTAPDGSAVLLLHPESLAGVLADLLDEAADGEAAPAADVPLYDATGRPGWDQLAALRLAEGGWAAGRVTPRAEAPASLVFHRPEATEDADRLARSLGLGPAALRPAADWTAAPPDAPLWVQVGADWRACPHP